MRRSILTVLVVGALVAGVGCSQSKTYKTDQGTTKPATPLSDAGPPAGTYRKQPWEVEIPGRLPAVEHSGGHLIYERSNGLATYDSRTGKRGWHFREPGRELSGWAGTREVVVAQFEARGRQRPLDRHFVGLDARSGEQLWEVSEDDWILGSVTDIDPDAGVVAVKTAGEDEDILGIDVRTGEERWSIPLSRLSDDRKETEYVCATEGGDSGTDKPRTEPIVVAGCDSGVVGIGAKSGRVRWNRNDVDPDDVHATIGGYTLVEAGVGELIDPDGGIAAEADGAGDGLTVAAGRFDLFSTGGRLVLTTIYSETNAKAVIVDPASRKTTRLSVGNHSDGERVAGIAAAGGKLYAQVVTAADGYSPVASTLAIVDLRSGKTERAVLPIPVHQFKHISFYDMPTLHWVAGRRLFFRPRGSDSPRFSSYALNAGRLPTALGGVSPKHWPRACDLVKGVPKGAQPHRPIGPTKVNGVRVAPLGCEVSLPEGWDAKLWVAWVGRTPADAAPLLPEDLGRRELVEVVPVGPVIVAIEEDSAYSEQLRDGVVRNVKRFIAESGRR